MTSDTSDQMASKPPPTSTPGTEDALEAFRREWRQEVSARQQQQQQQPNSQTKQANNTGTASKTPSNVAGSTVTRRKDNNVVDYSEELEPRAYHDLPDKEEYLRSGQSHDRDERSREDGIALGVFDEPQSALEHYERAVERETQGNLSESMKHYRTAFKLDDGVHEAYKRKHFPVSKTKPAGAATHRPTSSQGAIAPQESVPATLKQLMADFSTLHISPPDPPTDASPPERCPIAELPEELLTDILMRLAIQDVASFVRLAQVCKRLAYLVWTEESIWKRIALGEEFGFAAMRYAFACDVNGNPLAEIEPYPLLLASDEDDNTITESAPTSLLDTAQHLLSTSYANSWRQLFRLRPRIRFGGCYISTVNYNRAGVNSTNSLTWGAPVHVVTYFRYLRFFRNGSCISLLTTSEPVDVVHHLTWKNLPSAPSSHHHHSNHQSHHHQHLQQQPHAGPLPPTAVMKDALRGRWRLSSPYMSSSADDEKEGDLYIETQGVVPKYTYKMHLALAHAGKAARNNKLAWKGFWSYNKLTDDLAEFGLRNDRAFYWSRVKSYGIMGA